MAIALDGSRKLWLIPVAILAVGVVCTLLLWQSAERALLQLSRNQTALLHQAATLHLGNVLDRHEALASTLAHSLAHSANPRQTLLQAGAPLLWQFPELIAIERFAAIAPGQGPASWRQVQLISRGTAIPDPDLQPYAVPHWRAAVERAWHGRRPGATPVAVGSGALPETSSSRPSVHLFWPVPEGEAVSAIGDPPDESAHRQLLGLALSPDQLLAPLANTLAGATVEFRIFDISSQAADPIATAVGATPISRPAAIGERVVYEDRVSLADRQWLLRSSVDLRIPAKARGLLQMILVTGFALTLAIALVCPRLIARLRHHRDARARTLQRWEREHRAVQNAAIEKGILSRALQNSEQRTRDFIELGSAFSCELDEQWRIGFISPQIASLLDRPPADLADQPLLELLPQAERERVAEALHTCERERQTLRVDTLLLQPDGDGCPVSLRLKPIVDGINRCEGFRVVGWRRGDRDITSAH